VGTSREDTKCRMAWEEEKWRQKSFKELEWGLLEKIQIVVWHGRKKNGDKKVLLGALQKGIPTLVFSIDM
jgi:hypothetical protein